MGISKKDCSSTSGNFHVKITYITVLESEDELQEL
jgi:hypothetical protein